MKNYRVIWEIDVEARNPLEAAEEAKRIQQDPNSTANVFTIHDADEGDSQGDIDLGKSPTPIWGRRHKEPSQCHIETGRDGQIGSSGRNDIP